MILNKSFCDITENSCLNIEFVNENGVLYLSAHTTNEEGSFWGEKIVINREGLKHIYQLLKGVFKNEADN